MDVGLFDFPLPDHLIALRPAEPRDSARLLVVKPSAGPRLSDAVVHDLPELLSPGDMLVLNDTRVIPARLHGVRLRDGAGARVEIMLHKRDGQDLWSAFARPAKKLAIGDIVRFATNEVDTACAAVQLDAKVTGKGEAGEVRLRFDLAGPYLDEAIMRLGELPLPPYIAGKRPPRPAV
jgi:S-adenosylmethionine:tRNA ribosyltransferase-isomerase